MFAKDRENGGLLAASDEDPPTAHLTSQMDWISDTLRTMLISTKQPRPQVQPLDLNLLLQDLAHLTSPGMLRRDIRVYVDLQENLPKKARRPDPRD